MTISTKTGDSGDTGLFGGPRVGKDDPRIEAIGDVDELNAWIGLVRCEITRVTTLGDQVERLLGRVQHHLFDLGAELATPDPAAKGTDLLAPDDTRELEQAIDEWEGELPPLKQFILPGGTPIAASLHVARAVCRRAERRVVALARQQPLRPELVIYLNRLSDLLFLLARGANFVAGRADVAWEGRGARGQGTGNRKEEDRT